MHLHLLLMADYQTTWRLVLLFRQLDFRITPGFAYGTAGGSLFAFVLVNSDVCAGEQPLKGTCLLSGKSSVSLQLRRKRCFADVFIL